MHFPENFLYHIWQFSLFSTKALFCKDGERLQVLKPGILNKHAGPDFSQAKLIINNTLWVGNVEIHVKSSDWLLHGHQDDASFDSVILHVVYDHDKPVCRTDGSLIPVLELKGLFDDALFNNYQSMIGSVNKFPCEKQIADLDPFIINSFLSRVIVERFEQKSQEVLKVLDQLKGDWDETFYRFIARNFGFKVNAVPFEVLTSSLPRHILAKHKDNALQIDALIFGQAGFLNQVFTDSYPRFLKNEYDFFRKKYLLNGMDVSLWKFLRMRPQNFPTIRLAQFSGLINKSNSIFSKVLAFNDLKECYTLFKELPVNTYWQNHYHFNNTTSGTNVQLGMQSIRNIIINTVCLFLFTYGNYTDQPQFTDRALDFLEAMPPENNSIINQYSDSGLKPDNAFTTQALLQLNKCYCSQKKCLNCGIGIKILNK